MNVKSFEHACEINKRTPESVLPFAKPINPNQDALNAVAMLWEIIEAQNNGWKANYQDENEKKWFPIFYLFSGFAFANSGYGWTGAHTIGGSRFALKSEADAHYMGQTFTALYQKVLTIMPIQP